MTSLFKGKLRGLRASSDGATVVLFALTLPVVLGFTAFGVTFYQRNEQAARAQAIIDSAALAGVYAYINDGVVSPSRIAPGDIEGGLQQNPDGSSVPPNVDGTVDFGSTDPVALASQLLKAGVSEVPDITDPAHTTVSKDDANHTVTITYTSSTPLLIGSTLFSGGLPIDLKATAAVGLTNPVPVCLLVTDDSDGHTLQTKGSGTVDGYSCMFQVNTANWDAVQADDEPGHIIIHTPLANGDWNCYVGSIHYSASKGEISPAKQPSCTLLPDNYAQYSANIPHGATPYSMGDCLADVTPARTIPATSTTPATTIPETRVNVQPNFSNGTHELKPGTYCEGITISGNADVTFDPGIYYLKDNDLAISGGNVTAKGVVFVLTGNPTGGTASQFHGPTAEAAGQLAGRIRISGGTMTMLPFNDTTSVFNRFAIYQDQSNNLPDINHPHAPDMAWSGGNVTIGDMDHPAIVYLASTQLLMSNASLTLTGSLIVDTLHPNDGAHFTITGSALAMQKGVAGPILSQ